MHTPYKYARFPDMSGIQFKLLEYSRLKAEHGTSVTEIASILEETHSFLEKSILRLRELPEDDALKCSEPDDLDRILSLRRHAPRVLWNSFDEKQYSDRLAGAFLGRMAGCTLGAPVEFWSVEAMEAWAGYIGDSFPPTDYFSSIKNPNELRYGVSPFHSYTRAGMDGVPIDDDVTYTMLGLLILEEYGTAFTVNDVGKAWLKYLPYACTAEEAALNNLKAGIHPSEAALHDNPFVQWIGADIRSDPWGFAAPGLPELAARLAWNDAWLSHRRNGIYGEMYFSAAIAAAFTVSNPVEACWMGLNEIPKDCLLSEDICWALDKGKQLRNYRDARRVVDERFEGMSGTHTNLNACLTIFGLILGGDDFSRCIGETVAMGYDNDCTAATAGSLFGAARGLSAIPSHWHDNYHDTVRTYLIGQPTFSINDSLKRFTDIARETHRQVQNA